MLKMIAQQKKHGLKHREVTKNKGGGFKAEKNRMVKLCDDFCSGLP